MAENLNLLGGIVIGLVTAAILNGALSRWIDRLFDWVTSRGTVPEDTTTAEPVPATVRFGAPARRRFAPDEYDEVPVCTKGGHAFTEGEVIYVWHIPPHPVLGTPEGEMAVCEGHTFTGLTARKEFERG